MDGNTLMYIVIGLIIVSIVFSIIKKAIKIVFILIAILLAVSAYNIFVKGVSPKQEINNYKMDIQYSKDIKDYTVKIKDSVTKIKSALEGNENIDVIQIENKNIHNYKADIKELKHSNKLNVIHEKYCEYLDKVISACDTSVKVSNIANSDNVEKGKEFIGNITDNMNELTKFLGIWEKQMSQKRK